MGSLKHISIADSYNVSLVSNFTMWPGNEATTMYDGV